MSVILDPSSDAGPPGSFSWDARCLVTLESCGSFGDALLDERAYDLASVTRFAAGETKRFVVDFQVGRQGHVYWAINPGAYAFTGYYNGRLADRASAPDTVFLQP